MYFLECACQIQIDAMAGGMQNVQQMSAEAAATAVSQFKQFKKDAHPSSFKNWDAQLRLLDRKGIRYKD